MIPNVSQTFKHSVVQVRRWVVSLSPSARKRAIESKEARKVALIQLDNIARHFAVRKTKYPCNVLIDGLWDNPNYWLRYSLVRAALGLCKGRETGLIGHHSRQNVTESFSALGISSILDLAARSSSSERHFKTARLILREIRSSQDLLNVKFPFEFPASLVFDAILKRQRRATVDVSDNALLSYIADAIANLEAADKLFEEGAFDLLVLSHALDYTYSALAWAALRRGVPVLVLYGDYGSARFFRLTSPRDLYAYPGRPTLAEIQNMTASVRERLREQGAMQLRARLEGNTEDVGAVYAYQKRSSSVTKELLAQRFGWDPDKPIIGVYNSNWFDYPHASGLQQFRDFYDWIQQTLEVARVSGSVNWLFKAHPCDDWYASIKGDRLEDLVQRLGAKHIQLADKSWNGLDLIHSLDGIVTCHGTIGIEATSQGTPVLVAYPGWYGHADFVTVPQDRQHYLACLKSEWWKNIEIASAQSAAELFAGWMFCIPEWQGDFVMQDDSRQDAIYPGLPEFLRRNVQSIESEIREIAAWYESNHSYFHIFKVSRASTFRSLARC